MTRMLLLRLLLLRLLLVGGDQLSGREAAAHANMARLLDGYDDGMCLLRSRILLVSDRFRIGVLCG